MRNVKQFLAFNNLQRTNANAFNVSRTLNKSSFSLDVNNTPTIELKNYGDLDTQITTDTTTSALSYLDLTQVLPYLKAQSYVLGTEMQNLRLVIEWVPNADITKVLVGKGTDTISAITIIQPTLILDEVADPKVASKLKNSPITYVNLDHEVVNVEADATVVNQRLRAFDDKTVRRMLMINEDVNNSKPSAYMAGLTSYAMYNSKTQFTLNGQKMLPYEGITSANQQLAMLHDTWGTHILPQGAQYFDLDKKGNLYKAHDVFDCANESKNLFETTNLVGQMSYGGYAVNANVDELLLEYQRAAYSDKSKSITGITGANPGVVTTAANHGFANDDVVAISGATGEDADSFNGENIVVKSKTDNTFEMEGRNTTGKTFAGSAVVTYQKDYDKRVRSSSQMNLLFWGEVVKTMSVSNNNVSISYG